MTGVTLSKEVREGRPTLRVSWTALQRNVNVSEYQVQYKRNGTTVWSNQIAILGSPPATTTQLPALDAGTEYDVRVRPVAGGAEGEWSEVQTERTFNSEQCMNILYILRHDLLIGNNTMLLIVQDTLYYWNMRETR